METSHYRGMSKSASHTGRHLPNGKLNIAARWTSPGPQYYLPSTIGNLNGNNITVNKKPSYSFGLRLSSSFVGKYLTILINSNGTFCYN
jgi:hypothetical protein